MNPLDIIIIAILALFAVMSFFHGFIKEVFSLGGVILGVLVANVLYSSLGHTFRGFIDTPEIADVIAYAVLLVGVAAAMVLLGRLLDKFIRLALLKWADRSLGLAFGIAKGLILVCVLVMVLNTVLPQKNSFLANSQLRPHIESLYSFLPADVLKKLKEKKAKVEDYLQHQSQKVLN